MNLTQELQTRPSLESRIASQRRGDAEAFNFLAISFLGLLLAAALLVASLALTGSAHAQDNGQADRTMCKAYQDDYDRTMTDLANAERNGDWEKVRQLRKRIMLIRSYWNDECKDAFGVIGSIAFVANTAGTVGPLNGAVEGGPAGSVGSTDHTSLTGLSRGN